MRLHLDSDVLLDVLLRRSTHFPASAAVVDWAERHPGRASVAWHSLANIHYLSDDGAAGFIRELIEFAEVPATGTEALRHALELRMPDLEDAMVASAAIQFGAQFIVTRNIPDFRRSPVKALAPEQVLSLLR